MSCIFEPLTQKGLGEFLIAFDAALDQASKALCLCHSRLNSADSYKFHSQFAADNARRPSESFKSGAAVLRTEEVINLVRVLGKCIRIRLLCRALYN
jgi:hypothetical protein